MMMRRLETLRLTLEPQTAAHADEMFAVLSDPAIYEYENEPPISRDWLRSRFAMLETRQSADGTEQWLNWVIRLPEGTLIGYVQATVFADRRAMIAYELGSAWWGRGFAQVSTRAMIAELRAQYQVHALSAILKGGNFRSRRLLERLGFTIATNTERDIAQVDADEILMLKTLGR